MDKLELIFEKQKELQEKCFKGGIPSLTAAPGTDLFTPLYKWQNYVSQQLLAIHEETVEVMKETAYKNPEAAMYGYKKSQAVNIEKMRDELADLLHFFVNLCLASGMDAVSLSARYFDKHAVNVNRQKEGY